MSPKTDNITTKIVKCDVYTNESYLFAIKTNQNNPNTINTHGSNNLYLLWIIVLIIATPTNAGVIILPKGIEKRCLK